MSKYIDADKMIEDTKAMKRIAEGITIDGIIKYINEHSTDEVEKVTHSEWHTGTVRMNSVTISCRNCHRTEKISLTNEFEYCPHCGAKMDGANE